jgi:hypothetical protein
MPTRGIYNTRISGSDANSFCCYGLVYLLDSWKRLRSLIDVHLHLHRGIFSCCDGFVYLLGYTGSA